MSLQNFPLQISPEIGNVSTALLIPEKPFCMMSIAHGAGAGMNHIFMLSLAEALFARNIASLRFNFPFFENKKKRPDLPAVAHKTIEMAAQYAKENHPAIPLFLSGKSFGGRMGSQYLASHSEPAVKGIIFYGFPLHPPGKPSTERAEHLKKVKQPMLFLQGTKDTLAEWALIEEVCSSLPNATLVKLEGADHSFKKGKEDLVPQLAERTVGWIMGVLDKRR